MTQVSIRLGLAAVPDRAARVEGGLVEWRKDTYYRIAAYDTMNPFFISVMSDSDLWMYVSSRGGLTAGRGNADQALFPYETVDKLHVSHGHTGPRTVIRCHGDEEIHIWQPFSDDGRFRYEIGRSIYKHLLGCEIWFEEKNLSLGLLFRYGWRPSDRYGWVRTAELVNESAKQMSLEMLDGVQNLLPAGVGTGLQDSLSSLVDAYKISECDPETKVALYRLTSNIIDRAEASEALRATVVWQAGLPEAATVLDGTKWDEFMLGEGLGPGRELHGRRGSYLLNAELTLAPGEARTWHMALDTPVDQAAVVELRNSLDNDMGPTLEEHIELGRERLSRLLAGADAFQVSGDPIATAHHVSNVLYNIGRGGVLPNQYQVERNDLVDFIETRNGPVAERHNAWLENLPASLSLTELRQRAEGTGDTDLVRLCLEYLPLVFSRRHGDPSRPWNRFSIVMKNPDGSPLYAYQGNWRDIFQNWEALCRSFPECLEPMIAKFVNASTADGFNPYRVTRDGIDWELADPEDPWSSIGYWGDHQIVYLLKLLEASLAHHPGRLPAMLSQDIFCYADVPYDIRPYGDIVEDPQKTIDFNWERQRATDERVAEIGNDGRLVHRDGSAVHVNLAEKLLVPILAKLSSFVPGGGIWMNTMRPEWNDANNALAGNGMSVVTACYLHRHLGFCAALVGDSETDAFKLSSRVAEWLAEMRDVIREQAEGPVDDCRRRAFMDAAGGAFSKYRRAIYSEGPGERVEVGADDMVDLFLLARSLVGSTIRANRREDGLFHAYNILHLSEGTATVTTLPLMLEGQIAAMSSGLLTPDGAVTLLKALRASALYREDQDTYVLYPVKHLPAYLEMNRVPDSVLQASPTLAAMVEGGDGRIVKRDSNGQLRFHPDMHNAGALAAELGSDFPKAEARAILEAYEQVFNHKAFTGRSGTMYGYEGINCIYWHMNAKLLLAVQEAFDGAVAGGASEEVVEELRSRYFDIRGGLGFAKDPAVFGAFPLDPYSHTPGFAGARQPGMTGQAKEEILTRWGELGVHVQGGKISFRPLLLLDLEFLEESAEFSYVDRNGSRQAVPVERGSFAFTLCQVPVLCARGDIERVVVSTTDGKRLLLEGDTIPEDLSAEVFGRTGAVKQIEVTVRRS